MKLKIEKQSLAAGLLAVTFLIETSFVGNVLRFYTDTPRFIFTFVLLFLSIAITGVKFRQEFKRKNTIFLVIIATSLIFEAGFSFANLFYSTKTLLLIILLVFSTQKSQLIFKTAKLLILYFNIVCVWTLICLLLPEAWTYEAHYLGELPRSSIYAAFNFSGLVLTGDNPVNLFGWSLYRYSGVFKEPTIYMSSYILMLLICLLERKIGLIGWVLFLLNLLWSFSLTILLVVTFVLGIYALSILIRNKKESKYLLLLVIPLSLIFAKFGADPLDYALLKFNSVYSGGLAVYMIPEWRMIIDGTGFGGLSPFSTRGFYDSKDVNLFAFSIYAVLGIFVISQFVLLSLDHMLLKFNADRFIKISILTTVILLSLKSPAFGLSSWYSLMALIMANFVREKGPKKLKKY